MKLLLRSALPCMVFLLIASLLWHGLALHPNQVPSPLINKLAPTFELPTLFSLNKKITNKDLRGHVSLFNVWATWCVTCAEEHDLLLALANNRSIILYGLNYKDDPKAAKHWLKKYGNPYRLVAVDQSGDTAINWGVYGTPETFIIDKQGIVRYKQIGAITLEIWEKTLQPLVQQLEGEIA